MIYKKFKKEEEKQKKNIYNQKSKDNIMKIKHKKYKEIFNLLDLNQDGFISNTNVQLTNVDENICFFFERFLDFSRKFFISKSIELHIKFIIKFYSIIHKKIFFRYIFNFI